MAYEATLNISICFYAQKTTCGKSVGQQLIVYSPFHIQLSLPQRKRSRAKRKQKWGDLSHREFD